MIQETRWDSTLDDSIVNIPNYVIAARCDRVPDNAGGGCVILTTEEVMYNNAFSKSIGSLTQIAGIKIKDVYFVCIYRKPHYDKSNDKQTVNFLKKKLENKKVFIAGDLNLRDFNWKNLVVPGNSDQALSQIDARNAIWMDYLIELDLEQMVHEPTHDLDGQLDVILKNMDYDILAKVPEVRQDIFGAFSDHFAIVAEVNIVIEHKSKIRTIFDERNMPWDLMRNAFDALGIDTTVDDAIFAENKWLLIRDSIYDLRGQLCPLKKVGFSRKSPWINGYLRTLLRKERRLRRSACSKKISSRKRMLRKETWTRHRKFVRLKLKESRYNYEKGVVCRLATNNNSIHDYFKSKKAVNESPVIVDEDGENLYSDEDKCHRFQDHFMAIYNDYDKINVEWRDDAQFNNIELTEQKVKKVIRKMRSGTAPGFDTLNSTYFKELINQLAKPLLSLFQRVMSHGEMPMDWKISKVSPLFKGNGLRSDVKRWRPLSLGCVSLRILERILELDFRPFLEDNDKLPTFQHGFRSKRSCVTNLLCSWNMIAKKVDKGYSPNILSLDGSAAFDCLDIPEILRKLQDAGVGGKVGLFLQNWLTQRYQYVQINKSASYIAKVRSGVPQGSVLGPIIYILASSPGLVKAISETNDECARLGLQNRVRILTYADDIKCSFYLRNESDLDAVNILLRKLEEYTNATGLRFNAGKSQLLRFGGKNLECELMLLGSIIPEVTLMKDLGCWFNKNYTFIPMINTQISKAKRIIQMVRHGLKVRDSRSMLQIFQIYFQSRLLYSSEIWLNLEDATINKLNDIDEKFWALLPNDIEKPKCLSSAQVAVKKNLMMYFKMRHNLAIVNLDEKFKFMQTVTFTRLSMKKDLLLPKSRLAFRQKEFVSITTKLYNRMDPTKRESKLISVFAREAQKIAEEF